MTAERSQYVSMLNRNVFRPQSGRSIFSHNVYLNLKKKSNIKLSVAVLCYNHAPFLKKALESVLMQEVDFRMEIIIGDDASTDGSQKILEEIKTRHPDKIQLILKEKNEGVFKNIMSVLEACSGEYIALLETDDYWTHPQKLAKQVAFLDQNPDYTGCFHNAQLEWLSTPNNLPNSYMKNFKTTSEVQNYPSEFHPHHLMKGIFITTATLVFRKRNYIKELNLLSDINHLLAWAMTFFFIKKDKNTGGKFKYINEVWSVYVKQDQSLTFQKPGSVFSKIGISVLQLLLKDPFYKYYKSEIYRGLMLQTEIHFANSKAENASGLKQTAWKFLKYGVCFVYYRFRQFWKEKSD